MTTFRTLLPVLLILLIGALASCRLFELAEISCDTGSFLPAAFFGGGSNIRRWHSAHKARSR